MAALAHSESDKSTRWRRVAAASDLRAAASSGRGLFVARDESRGDPPLALFLSPKDDSVFALEDACPHAGHQMSKSDQLIGDIEDYAPGCGLGVVVACPAHAFTYDAASGYCLSNPGSGGRASRWEARLDRGGVFVGSLIPVSTFVPAVTKEQADRMQLALVGQALERKYGS